MELVIARPFPKVGTYVVVVVDSHNQRIVLATEETTVTQHVSHRPIKAALYTIVLRSPLFAFCTPKYFRL